MTWSHKGRSRALVLLVLGLLSSLGCQHRRAVATLPPVVQVANTPAPPIPKAPAMESAPPASISTAPAVKVTEAKPPRRIRRTPPKKPVSVTPPPEVATAAPPVSPVGSLSTGDDADPRKQQDATGLITSGERRLEALSAGRSASSQGQMKEIRHFLDGAKEALATGDLQGATTLGNKARLLLDDLEKAAQR